MKKIFQFGKVAYDGISKTNLVEVEINIKTDKEDRPVFSASATVWNSSKTDCYLGGQCLDTIIENYGNQLKNKPLYNAILGLWHRNHLNDKNAGTPAQTSAVNEFIKGKRYEYSEVCEHLKFIGLYEVDLDGSPYKYGHGWIYRDISPEDLDLINTL